MNKKHVSVILFLSIITGCNSFIPIGFTPQNSVIQENKAIINPQVGGIFTTYESTIGFELFLPKNRFQTKAFDFSLFKYFKVFLTDSTGKVYFLANVIHDANPAKDNLIVPVDGKITVVFKNVKFDSAIYAQLFAFDENKVEIPGSKLYTSFAFKGGSKKIEISYRSTPIGKIIKKLLETNTTESLQIAKNILNNNSLQEFIDEITGVSGVFPDYIYVNNPSLIDIDKIVADLLGNNGNTSILNPDNPAYQLEAKIVSGNIKGLVSTDKVRIRVDDSISQILTGSENGVFSISTLSGIWQTFISVDAGAGTTYTFTSPIATDATNDINLGDIILTPAIPSIISLTPSAKKGAEITITGTNFHANNDGNVVKFGSETATVSSVTSSSEIKVLVPDGIFGSVKVTVGVGNQTSNQGDFEVTPDITSFGSTGAKIGSDITINGTGFSTTMLDNKVMIGGKSANVTYADNHKITATVPDGLYDNVGVTVKVGNKTSSSKTFDVTPVITSLSKTDLNVDESIEINGTGFDFVTPGNNIVKFGTTTVNASDVSVNVTGTILTVKAPNAANANVTVTVDPETSNGTPFYILPKISISAPSDNDTVHGAVSLKATVISPNSISSVEFFYGGTNSIGTGTLASGTYNYSWDTLNPPLTGDKTITAKVTDTAGKTATSTGIDITIDQLPVITSITAGENPVSGLGYPVLLTADASDDGTFTYSWSTLNGTFGTFSDKVDNTVIWRAPSTGGGDYDIQLSVDDGVNPAVTKTFTINVKNSNAQVDVNGGAH